MTLRARENPFRTSRLGALRFRHPTLDFAAIAERLESHDRRAEIVGPHGSGKTTLLGELGEHLEGDGFAVHRWRFHADRTPPATRGLVAHARSLGARDALLVDGAGHLARTAWWRVRRAARHAGALVVTAHETNGLPLLVETTTDPALLTGLTRELVGDAAHELEVRLEALFDAHRGNLRDVFLALYDLAADGDAAIAPRPSRAGDQEFSSSSVSGPPSPPLSPTSSSSAGTTGSGSSPGLASSSSVVGIPMRNAAKPGMTT